MTKKKDLVTFKETDYYDDFLSRASRYCDLSKVIVEKNNLNNLNKILLK